MSLNNTYYTEDVNSIVSVDFSVLTNKDVKKYSAVSKDPFGINIAESYDNYEPKKGGLVDLRLGTCDPYLNCTTCGLNHIECPGHFGHTELAEPVYHFGFLNNLKTILQCICFKCTSILIEKDEKLLNRILNKKEKFRRGASTAALLCVHRLHVERREVSLSNCLSCCDEWGAPLIGAFPYTLFSLGRNCFGLNLDGSFIFIFIRSDFSLSGIEAQCSLYTRPDTGPPPLFFFV